MAFGSLGRGVCASNKPAAFWGLVGSPESQFCQKASLGVVVLPAKSPFRRAVLPASTFSAGFLACKIAWNSRLSPLNFFLAAKTRRATCAACPVCQPGLSPSLAREGRRVRAWQVGFPACAFCPLLCHNYFQARLYLSRLASRLSKLSAPGRFSGWWLVPS